MKIKIIGKIMLIVLLSVVASPNLCAQYFLWSTSERDVYPGDFFYDSHYYGDKKLDASQLEVNYLCSSVIDTLSNLRFDNECVLMVGKTWTKYQERHRSQYEKAVRIDYKTAAKEYCNYLRPESYYVLYSDTYFYDISHRKNIFTVRLGADDYKIEESATDIKWKIIDSTKVIGGHSCTKAEADFGGRHWVAWFSTEIALPYGPWKLRGLPGLILEAEDSANQYCFSALSISSVQNDITMAEYPYILISRKQYNKMVRESIEDYTTFVNQHISRYKRLRSIESPKELKEKYNRPMRFGLIEQ